MLYRAAGHDKEHVIRLGKAVSDDGIHFKRCSDKPFFAPLPYEADAGCVEDPRLIKIGNCYYMTYASRLFAPGQYWKQDNKPTYTPPQICPRAVAENSTVTHIAYTYDFKTFKKLGRIFIHFALRNQSEFRRVSSQPDIVHYVALQNLIQFLMHHRNAVFECFL